MKIYLSTVPTREQSFRSEQIGLLFFFCLFLKNKIKILGVVWLSPCDVGTKRHQVDEKVDGNLSELIDGGEKREPNRCAAAQNCWHCFCCMPGFKLPTAKATMNIVIIN